MVLVLQDMVQYSAGQQWRPPQASSVLEWPEILPLNPGLMVSEPTSMCLYHSSKLADIISHNSLIQ